MSLIFAITMKLPVRPRTIVLIVMVVVILLLLALPFSGVLKRYETRLVQLTDGPHDMVREKDSVLLSRDVVLYSRTGTILVKDNSSGQMETVWDNGTYVLDLDDMTEVKVADEVIEVGLSNNMVVWREDRSIMHMNVFTGSKRVLPIPGASPVSRPDIHEDRIVWADNRFDLKIDDNLTVVDIFMFDTSTETEARITTTVSNKGAPSVWNDLVVWADDRNGNFDIYGYNISNGTEFRVTYDEHGQYEPKASSRAIVWVDTRTTHFEWQEDLFYLDLGTWTEVQASDSGSVESFDVWGNRIVWEDLSLENRPHEEGDILVHNIQKNKTKLYFASDWGQWSPSVHGGMLIWVDGSREGGEIFFRERIERPIFGLDEVTLWTLLVLGIFALMALGAFWGHLWKERRDRERFERRKGLKKRTKVKEREPPERRGRKKGKGRPRPPPKGRGPGRRRGR